jgi:hypothetical protein
MHKNLARVSSGSVLGGHTKRPHECWNEEVIVVFKNQDPNHARVVRKIGLRRSFAMLLLGGKVDCGIPNP